MELPAEIFEELTAGASFVPQTPGSDLRATPRVRTALSVPLLRLNDPKHIRPAQATVTDLSTRGVGLQFSEPIHVDAPFAIRLPRRTGSPIWIQCVAVRWSPIDGKIYSIGAKFSGVFSPPKGADAESAG